MSVYSVSVWRGQLTVATSPLTVYTVPAGKVLVLRDGDFFSTNAGATYVSWRINGSGLWLTDVPSPLLQAQWRGRQVLNAGDVLALTSGAGSIFGSISGYLLDA